MNARRFLFIISLLFSMATYSNKITEGAGVPWELATLRKQTIHNLEYKLSFTIPKVKAEIVTGKVLIHFTLSEKTPLIVDFREEADKVRSLLLNGKQVPYRVSNEHIIIDQKNISKGTNELNITFIAGNQSLNRNDEFLYTLLVPDRARTLFPCFDQPNLKARFTLELQLPASWSAVSNSGVTKEMTAGEKKNLLFATTEPLSTYLFAFAAGEFKQAKATRKDRTIAAYYRETDEKKIAQLDTVFSQIFDALEWQEAFTGIAYPFSKYDFVVLPGFQFGGMEHTGATFYNDRRIFLNEHATPDEELERTQLITHETSHMWFGDLVTMNWFDDVWTKEVFANYFASVMSEPVFPKVNHRLNSLKTFTAASLSEDRTLGTTSIQQPLDNLSNAGLIYGNIIYDKAPVMMQKLVGIMGWEAFRSGIRQYLTTYAYGNATWDDLINILDSKTDADLTSFSNVWVKQKGMPDISLIPSENGFIVRQTDPWKRGLVWPQRFAMKVMGEKDTLIHVDLRTSECEIPLGFAAGKLLPNYDGQGYGRFLLDKSTADYLLNHWAEEKDDLARQSYLMTLYENRLCFRISNSDFVRSLLVGLKYESNDLVASSIVSYLWNSVLELRGDERGVAETNLFDLSNEHPLTSCRIQIKRMLRDVAESPKVVGELYEIWDAASDQLLSERDYTSLAYNLCLKMPEKYETISAKQRARISNSDRLREFDFIIPSLTPDSLKRDSLFQSLSKAENRRIEPWTQTVLAFLNHRSHEAGSVKYIRPGLELLKEVQRTGDIFFPRGWANALLGSHRSTEAYQAVKTFFAEHPDYPQLLKNKILQAAYPLYRANGEWIEPQK